MNKEFDRADSNCLIKLKEKYKHLFVGSDVARKIADLYLSKRKDYNAKVFNQLLITGWRHDDLVMCMLEQLEGILEPCLGHDEKIKYTDAGRCMTCGGYNFKL